MTEQSNNQGSVTDDIVLADGVDEEPAEGNRRLSQAQRAQSHSKSSAARRSASGAERSVSASRYEKASCSPAATRRVVRITRSLPIDQRLRLGAHEWLKPAPTA